MPETPPTASELDADGYSWPRPYPSLADRYGASSPEYRQHVGAPEPVDQLLAQAGDPVSVFAKLVREVEAGSVLVSLATSSSETRRAALDALALARDVLRDGLTAVQA